MPANEKPVAGAESAPGSRPEDSFLGPPAAAPLGGVPSRRNYVLGVLNGTLNMAAFDFIHPELILAGLVYVLTGSKLLVALLSVINKGASLLPQLVVGSYLEHRPQKRPFYVGVMVVRAGAAVLLVAAFWLLTHEAEAADLTLFFVAWLLVSLCGGMAHVIMLDMVGRMIRIERIGGFFGAREFAGGVFSLLIGWWVVHPILGMPGVGLTGKYLVFGIAGGVLAVLAMGLLALSREVPGPRARRRTTFLESLRRGWGWLRADPNYRAYFWLRVAFRVNDLAFAFFIPYGVDRLRYAHDPLGVVALGGLLMATFKLSRVAASILWGWTVDTAGDRVCLIGTGICFFLGPVLALLAPLMPEAFEMPIPLTGAVLDLPLCVYFLALAAIGAGVQGSIIGGNRFLILRAPPHRRLSYIGFLNTATSPLTLLPLAAGYLAARAGVTVLFAILVFGGVLWTYWALRMEPDRPEMREDAPAGGGTE